MPKVSFNFETNEELIEFMKTLPEKETSTTAKNHGTRSTTNIIPHPKKLVKENPDGQLFIETESEEVRINRVLKPTETYLGRGGNSSLNVIGASKFMGKWLYNCATNIDKFLEPIWIIKSILPNDGKRFSGKILKGVCEFVDTYYEDKNYNSKNIVEFIGATSVNVFLLTSEEHGGICDYLRFAHDYNRIHRLGNPAGKSIGENIKRVRMERKMKQSDLSELVGVSPSLISHFETGSRNPDDLTLFHIAGALGVDEEELRNGVEI